MNNCGFCGVKIPSAIPEAQRETVSPVYRIQIRGSGAGEAEIGAFFKSDDRR
jgi:hypothetical protein